jgi:hypothetical protein
VEPGGLQVTRVPVDALDAGQLAAWSALHLAQDGAANPFSSPEWVTAWYRHFVPRGARQLLWITDRDRLVGVAPMYLQHLHLARLPVARRLTMVGSGRSTPIEIPPLLCATGRGRAVTRAIALHALTHDVSWAELSLSRDHGWLLATVLSGPDEPPIFQRHQQLRACVVLPLADTWEQTRSGLRRNVKESLRRARNRLAKDGRPSRIVHRTGTDLDFRVVERLLALHGERSRYQGSSSAHNDAFADPANASFLRDVLPPLGRAGQASVVELELDGEVVAIQLVLHPPGGIYFHSSGFLPREWQLSPVTTLQAAAIERAVERGDRWVNFSPGPNEAKLRWSDQLLTVDDYAFGFATHAALTRYTAFFLAKDVRQLRQERAKLLQGAPVAGAPAK